MVVASAPAPAPASVNVKSRGISDGSAAVKEALGFDSVIPLLLSSLYAATGSEKFVEEKGSAIGAIVLMLESRGGPKFVEPGACGRNPVGCGGE